MCTTDALQRYNSYDYGSQVFVLLIMLMTLPVIFISAKWTEWNWTICCFHFCVSVCVSVCVSAHSVHWFEWAEWCIVRQKCIRFVREKLMIFPYGQYIVGIYVSLTFWLCSQVQDRSGVLGEMYKNVTPFPMFWLCCSSKLLSEVRLQRLCCHSDNNHTVGTNIRNMAFRANVKFKVSLWT